MNVAVKVNVGDFIVFHDNEYYHNAIKFIGDRISLIFCVKLKTLENAQQIVKDRINGINSYAVTLKRK